MTAPLFSWFAGSVERHPAEVALEVDGQVLTYAELGAVVDRLAARLLARDSRPPRRVALLAGRTLAAYAGYLAALRIGATVIPLDPAGPAARAGEVCRLVGADVVVVDRHGARMVGGVDFGGRGVGLVDLSAAGWEVRSGGGASVAGVVDQYSVVDPEFPAYVVFTSGVTGRPKGVPVRSGDVAGVVGFGVERFEVGPGCRWSQTFDLTAEPSVFDLFVAWGSGAAVVVPGRSELLLPARFVNGRGITHWFSVPSAVSAAVGIEELPAGSMPGLRFSLFTGEQLTVEQAGAWRRAAPGSRVENLYGLAELAGACCGYRLPEDVRQWPVTSNGTVPIGAVFPGVEAVLVADGRVDEEEGELCVRGSQRFAGYLDPVDDGGRFVVLDGGVVVEAAVEVAVEGAVDAAVDGAVDAAGDGVSAAGAAGGDGFAGGAGIGDDVFGDDVFGLGVAAEVETPGPDHWFRTGDRVRVEDGVLVHLGRVDDRVRIRGVTVEPGEIEAVLRAHDGVRDAVVMARPSQDGGVELHAFYTGDPLAAARLGAALAATLPAYLVPKMYVHMPAFPMTDSGKIDRRRFGGQPGGIPRPRAGA